MDSKEYLDAFRRYLSLERNLSKNTSYSYCEDMKLFFDYCEKRRLDILKVDSDSFGEYLWAGKKKGLRASSLFRKTEAAKAFYKFLALENILKKNPLQGFKAPRPEKKLPKTLSQNETEKLLSLETDEKYSSLRTAAALELLYASGIRISELINIKTEDLNLPQGWIRVFGKGSKERLVPVNEKACAVLKRYIEERNLRFSSKSAESYVFLNKSGKKISRIQLWKDIKAFASAAGIDKNVHPHLLRHSFATHLLQRGADLMSISEMLGHSSLSTTQIYTHLDNSQLKEIHKKYHPKG
ncbi:MAG: site-specific tyrosine recombinase XerD [Elusimicrobia bacterium]|nr:site-specific tyrosine recombinase XerD [Elusimicrobiota bacterium]